MNAKGKNGNWVFIAKIVSRSTFKLNWFLTVSLRCSIVFPCQLMSNKAVCQETFTRTIYAIHHSEFAKYIRIFRVRWRHTTGGSMGFEKEGNRCVRLWSNQRYSLRIRFSTPLINRSRRERDSVTFGIKARCPLRRATHLSRSPIHQLHLVRFQSSSIVKCKFIHRDLSMTDRSYAPRRTSLLSCDSTCICGTPLRRS